MKIKFCGIKRLEDINYVNILKPDYIGFVFCKKSKRYVDLNQVKLLKGNLNKGILTVGVYLDNSIEEIIETIPYIDIIQLHGYNQEDIDILKKYNKPIIKAIAVNSINDIKEYDVDYMLYDSSNPGSGKTFDWNLLKNKNCFLAGGININNINDVIKLNPYCIDISSGIEEFGVKSFKLMKQIIEKVRNMEGKFGEYGGYYVPEILMNAVLEVKEAYEKYKDDPEFIKELDTLYKEYAGRPSLLYYAEKMTKDLGGAKIYLKREDLNHTGSHKINNVLGQALLAKRMGKKRLIAETGAGQHGVATATVAAYLNMECEIFMGAEDMERQKLNVFRMEMLGAKVHPVESGTKVLKDAVNEAMREWSRRMDDTLYLIGSAMGPHPFPTMVEYFQSVISKESKAQILKEEGRLPDYVIACVGGGSNAIGSFHEYLDDLSVNLVGCEAAGKGADTPLNAATMANGTVGIFHGMKSYFCQNEEGQIAPVYSISAGLDYPGVGPHHSYLKDTKRASYVSITDQEAVDAFLYLSKMEGIIPAIESSHAVAYAMKLAPTLDKDKIIIITISGRGDKDVAQIARYLGVDISE